MVNIELNVNGDLSSKFKPTSLFNSYFQTREQPGATIQAAIVVELPHVQGWHQAGMGGPVEREWRQVAHAGAAQHQQVRPILALLGTNILHFTHDSNILA